MVEYDGGKLESLNIKSEEAHTLAARGAQATDESLTEAT